MKSAAKLPPTVSKTAASEFEALVVQFLAMLQDQRNASVHTVRAYRRELQNFVAYLAETLGPEASITAIDHLHIRAYLGQLYEHGSPRPAPHAPSPPSAPGFAGLPGSIASRRTLLRLSPHPSSRSICRVPSMEEVNGLLNSIESATGESAAQNDSAAAWPERDA